MKPLITLIMKNILQTIEFWRKKRYILPTIFYVFEHMKQIAFTIA